MIVEKCKILVVEDDALISETITKSLKLEGFSVDLARDGDECIKKVRDNAPDLILLDVLLPTVDGWETLTMLRNDPSSKDIPIIILTALSDETSIIQGLRGGADDYITKPFSSLELVARVEAVLKRVGRREPLREKPSIQQIPAKKGDKIVLIDPEDITYIHIHRDCTYIYTEKGRFITGYALSELENMLDPDKFFRAHRSYIVNLKKVKEIAKVGTSSYELTMNDPERSRVPMSRRQSAELKKILNI